MPVLTPAQRRELRARAHLLHPVVSVGRAGLTAPVLHEIDVNLLAHELVKVRVFGADRDTREVVLARICAELDAAPVQHIGKLLVVWRPAPEPPAERARARAPAGGKTRTEEPRARRRRVPPQSDPAGLFHAAKSSPRARRPREPAARTPARPPAARRGRAPGATPAGGRRRRGGPKTR